MTMITPSYLGETIEYSSLHACRSTLEDPTLFLPRKLFQQVPGENPATRELDPSLHQIEDCIFSLAADDGQVAQVDHKSAIPQVMACVSPGPAELRNPGSEKCSFHDQRAPRPRIDCRNLKHCFSLRVLTSQHACQTCSAWCPRKLLNLFLSSTPSNG